MTSNWLFFIGDVPWKTIGGNMFGINAQFLKEGFTGWLSLLWLHPHQADRIVHLGTDSESKHKVVYQGPYTSRSTTKPHGAWSFHPNIENYPSAVEPGSLVLVVKFHFRGEEEEALETLFGRVRGTTNVFIAMGTNVPAVGVRIYQDEEILAMRDFHIHAIVLGEVHEGLKAFMGGLGARQSHRLFELGHSRWVAFAYSGIRHSCSPFKGHTSLYSDIRHLKGIRTCITALMVQ